MGIRLDEPFPLYPDGFPPEIMEPFEAAIGRAGPGERAGLGHRDHRASSARSTCAPGEPIVYTSGDSVFQIACHKARRASQTLYEWCRDRTATPDRAASRRAGDRPAVRGPAGARSCAAPSDGTSPCRRRAPRCSTRLARRGVAVYGVGKIQDIFDRSGHHRGAVLGLQRPRGGPHARVPARGRARRSCSRTSWTSTRSTATATTRAGYAAAIEAFDRRLPELIERARRRRDADHRRPRLRPDHAADRPLPGADAAARGRAAGWAARDRDAGDVRRSRRHRGGSPGRRGRGSRGRASRIGSDGDPRSQGTSRSRVVQQRPEDLDLDARKADLAGQTRWRAPVTVSDPRQIVAAKRDGQTLAPSEVEAFIEGYTRGDVERRAGGGVPDGVPAARTGRRRDAGA